MAILLLINRDLFISKTCPLIIPIFYFSKRVLYSPYPSFSKSSFEMKRRAAEFMQ